MKRGAAIYLTIITSIFFSNPAKSQVLEQDSLALIDFFINASGEDWLIPWDTTKEVNEWFGVILTQDNSRVEGLALPNNQLSGQLSLLLSDLQKLTSLDLSNNQIGGEIPVTLGSLDTLVFMDLSGNLISDTIPDELGNLQYLKTLNLSNNDLQGEIPATIGNLDSLRVLDVSTNQLNGIIPTSIGNLDSLNSINLAENSIEGDIPSFLQNLKSLREIDISSNSISGTIPTFWSEFEDLRILRLNDNEVEGQIPVEIGVLNTLTILDISNNLLQGEIPQEIGNLDSIRTLDLSGNLLTKIPATIVELEKLEVLDLSDNDISGPLPVLAGISDQLRVLELQSNDFTGPIPSEYGNLISLEQLDLSNNALSENLPSSFTNLVLLERLDLSGNMLVTLTDVSELGVTGSLQEFAVGNNKLEFDDLEVNFSLFGDSTDYSPQSRVNDTLNVAVPTGNTYSLLVDVGGSENQYRWVFESEDSLVQISYDTANYQYAIEDFQESNSGSYTCEVISTLVPGLVIKRNPINLFPAINTLDSLALIQFNKATGGNSWIRKWDVLSEPVFTWEGVEIESGTVVGLELEDNNLSGYLTDSLQYLSNLKILNLRNNDLEDTIPASIGELGFLEILDLGNNQIEGRIPESIGQIDSLRVLNLSRNNLTEGIPLSFSNLHKIRILDLSRNNLDSTFSFALDSLWELRELILSDNDLEGVIPAGLNNLRILETLALGDNQFEGEIPVELGQLDSLIILDLSENRLSGIIPENIADLKKLEELKLFRNQLSGGLPESFTSSLSLERIFINDNKLTSLPKFSSYQFNNLEVRAFNNVLTFDDFVDNFIGFNNADKEDEFLFLPQPTIIDNGSQTLQRDDSVTLTIPDLHVDNKYRWLKEGASLGVESPELKIDSAKIETSGVYIGQVWTTNPTFNDQINSPTDSLLFSFTYTILVPPPMPDVKDPEPFCIGNETITLANDFDGQTGLVSRWYNVHPSSGGEPFSEEPTIKYQLKFDSDTIYVSNGLIVNSSFESEVDTVVVISRPWIVDRVDFLEVAPSDSLLDTRFLNSEFTSSYQWFFNGNQILGQTGNILQNPLSGNYHVRIIRGGCSSTSTEYTPPGANLTTGIHDQGEPSLMVYPNPVVSNLSVLGLDEIHGAVNISIVDLRGAVLFVKNLKTQPEIKDLNIDVSDLKKGVYLLRATYADHSSVIRFYKE